MNSEFETKVDAEALKLGCNCPTCAHTRRQAAMQGLADALREGLRLYGPGSAGLWAEQARAALNAAGPEEGNEKNKAPADETTQK